MIKLNKLKLISLLLCLVMLIAPLFASAEFDDDSELEIMYDYSRPDYDNNTILNSADILEMYLGEKLSAVERDYLAVFGETTLSYDGKITTAYVSTEYDEAALTLSVEAFPYSYDTSYNEFVEWVPVLATVGENSIPLIKDGDTYKATLSGVSKDEFTAVDVKYEAEFYIMGISIVEIINKAYEDAPYYKDLMASAKAVYEKRLAEYNAKVELYEEYLKNLSYYKEQEAIYLDYLAKLHVYNEALGDYEKYLSDLAKYEQALLDKEQYDKDIEEYKKLYNDYREYLSKLDGYNAEYELYEEYLEKLGRVKEHLSFIEATKVPMTNKRTVYAAIKGTLVDSVLENKSIISGNLVSVPEEVIDSAGKATERLRELLTYYFSLTSEADKYAYYTINYEAFRDNFTLLCQSLDNLYRNEKVRGYLIFEDKDEKYYILVCQLAIIANALSDGPIKSYYGDYKFDESYRIEEKTISQVLENQTYILNTGTAKPLKEGYPEAIPEPILPEIMEEPVKPTPVKIPAKPDEVDHPGEPPAEVKKPVLTGEVQHPGEPPIMYDPGKEVFALIDAYDKGLLYEREMKEDYYNMKLERTVTKSFYGVEEVVVTYYGTNGEFLYAETIDKGSLADFKGKNPTKPSDASAVYVFEGWMDGEGNRVDLGSIEKSVNLYPSFRVDTKYYTVTFAVGEELTVLSVPYGAMPEYDGVPYREGDDKYDYVFVNWDKELVPVTGEAVYTAIFERTYIMPFEEGGGASITEEGNYYVVDATMSTTPRFNLSSLIRRAVESANGYGIILKTRFCNMTVSFANLLKMHENGDTVIAPRVMQYGTYGYGYSIDVLNAENKKSEYNYRINGFFPCQISNPSAAHLFYGTEADRSYVSYELFEGTVSFTVQTQNSYSLIMENDVDVIPSKLVELSVSQSVARPGDVVYLEINVPNGITLEKIYLIDEEGNETEITGGRFTMPDKSVTVGVQASQNKYKITFMNGKQIIAIYTMKYGDTVIPPKEPMKASDALYSYRFLGWSGDILPVTSDAVYRAEFKAEPLPVVKDDGGLKISDGVMRIIVTGLTSVFLLLFVMVPSLIIGIKNVKKVKKSYIQKKEE